VLVRVDGPRLSFAHDLAVNCKDGSVLVRIPAGEFEMGDGNDTACPKHKVRMSEYWMGVYCVTNRQYGRFVEETGHRVPETAEYGTPVWMGGRCPEEKQEHPVVYVDWEDASAYAAWSGLVLPTEAQWEKAVRGPLGLLYPWGGEWDGTRCRHHKNRESETTSPVGAYAKGVSGYGTSGQSGNVWEWCRDWYEGGYYGKGPSVDPAGPESGSVRVIRGGGWGNVDTSDFRGAYRFGYAPAARRRDFLGFRVVRTAS
jgi:formylglycine-generating enzyme required for sulfatase activity